MPEARGRETRAAVLLDPQARAADGDADVIRFTGHAAVFDAETYVGPPGYGFRERVDPGFFDPVLGAACPLLVNHNPDLVLARNGSTMRLSTDERGLVVDADLDRGDPDAAAWAGRVRRGDLGGMSFQFTAAEERWEFADGDGGDLRVLLVCAELFDVSLVTFPAYAGTDAQVRAALASRPPRPAPAPEPAPGPAPVPVVRGLTAAAARVRARGTAARYRLPLP